MLDLFLHVCYYLSTVTIENKIASLDDLLTG